MEELDVRVSNPIAITELDSGSDHRIFLGDCVDLDELGFSDLPVRDCSVWSSKPFLFLDLIWNFIFVLVSVFVLLISVTEKPSTPLRVWIGGYALQCLLNVGFVYLDYRKWNTCDFGVEDHGSSFSLCQSRISKRLQSMNTVISSIWWGFGFYWIVVGGQSLMQDSPRLYWLSVIFLAFEVLFVMVCIGMACIILFTMLCYFPIVATIAYVTAIGQGASENDLRTLPKFQYSKINHFGTSENAEKQDICGLVKESGKCLSTPKLVLHPEDSECCICLHGYVEGVDLCNLPCRHHFHHGCISKWLRINATCPLCKLSIFRDDMV